MRKILERYVRKADEKGRINLSKLIANKKVVITVYEKNKIVIETVSTSEKEVMESENH